MTPNLGDLIRAAGDAAAPTNALPASAAASLLRAARRRHLLHQAAAGTAAVCVAALIGVVAVHPWTTAPSSLYPATSTKAPPGTNSASPTATASPTSKATQSANHPLGRNPAMTDAEALQRVTEPQTGEHWFGTAREISVPQAMVAAGNDFGSWYELGIHGNSTIVGWDSSQEIDVLFERAPDGSYTQIDYPSPRQSASTATNGAEDHGLPHDPTTFYDTFAVPVELSLPSGDPVEAHVVGSYGLVPYVRTDQQSIQRSSAGTFAGFEIVRDDQTREFLWGNAYGINLPAGVTIQDWVYMLRTPWGTEVALDYNPLGPVGDIRWDAKSGVSTPALGTGDFVDLNDSVGGSWSPDYNSVVRGLSDSDWMAAGSSQGGRTVYIPTKDNPLLAVMYRTYAEHRDPASIADNGGAPLSQEEFRLGPGLIAYRTPSSGSWVVWLNKALEGARQWN